MSHSDNTAKTVADNSTTAAYNTANNAQYNPYATAAINKAGQNLDDISAGKFGGLPLVQAVNQAANTARSWRPQAQGDAALASEANGVGGYAQQSENYRRRQIDDNISNLMPQAVEAERNYNTSVLFPGAQSESAFQLSKAGALTGNTNAAANLYNISGNMGFWNKLTNAFGSGLGGALGSSLGSFSYNGGSSGFSMGAGGGG